MPIYFTFCKCKHCKCIEPIEQPDKNRVCHYCNLRHYNDISDSVRSEMDDIKIREALYQKHIATPSIDDVKELIEQVQALIRRMDGIY